MNKKDKIIPVLKNIDKQQLVPSIWRDTLTEIVESIKNRDYESLHKINGVEQVSNDDILFITENIDDYGDDLVSLPKKSWKTSACLWMGDFWEVFVDLYTEEEGHSDLVLALHVYEKDSSYKFKIRSVYVP